ncbi:polysaccharide biosynthesis/export family protein [Novosphingobium lentum]|uniref:polysaccharide biosynthesis/export family protein n=1 Tax=Novosphingobium lentum TaxID=145287 RepID=UPI000832796F|nr:polysaccharide biosynthesis/export family protein [Novosphingobium lentum]
MNHKTCFRLLFAAGLLVGLSACAAHTTVPAPSVSQAIDYRLDGGDGLRVIIYGEDKLSGEYHVGGDGRLALPLIGAIMAKGRTVQELQDAIAADFTQGGFFINPRVAVEILNYRPFFILGEVNAPGQYPFIPGLSVRQAIATAKGYTYRARHGSALITHWGEDKEVEYEMAPGSAVNPGDTIRIAERHF